MSPPTQRASEQPHDPSIEAPETLPIARRLAQAAGARGFPLRWNGKQDQTPRMPMVGWFDPGQLIRTGFRSAVSIIVGEQSDRRVIQALGSRHVDVHDYSTIDDPLIGSHLRDSLWLDYLADTGDGFNPTYACAWLLSQPRLEVAGTDGQSHQLPRAALLVLGGDQVYPAPSREAYQSRLVVPFETASRWTDPSHTADVFAVPGNHDWYDGLSAFLRLFCSDVGGRQMGAWQTRQTRSYFTLKLPGGWWLIGADSQLQADLDVPQIAYFESVAQRMSPGERLIICLSTPVWVHAHKYRQMGEVMDETDLIYLRDHVFAPRGVTVSVHLSGDLHHYRRHEELDPDEPLAPVQKITAGGGGAFLHPTHDEDVSLIEDHEERHDGSAGRTRRFALKSCYPSMRQSWWMSFGNLAFGVINPRFGIVPALIYLMTAWLVSAAVGYRQADNPLQALRLTIAAFANEPGLTLWVIAVVAAFVGFNVTRSVWHRWAGGIAHAAAHWVAMFYIGWGARLVVEHWLPGEGPFSLLLSAGLIFAGGWVVGSVIMGLYLLISLNVFGRHSEEAFSALRIQDYKNFLRIHIASDGTLTIYPLAVDRVPRRWRDATDQDANSPSELMPAEPLQARLIESPIVLRPGQT